MNVEVPQKQQHQQQPQHTECIRFNKHLTVWCDEWEIVRNELYKHWFYELFRTASGALLYTCQFIWSMFAITAFVNSCHYFFTWHVALGHWHYWFKNNNMVAVWTRFMSISIKHLHTVICFALFFTKSFSLPIIIDITDIIITLSQHESTARFTYQAKGFYITVNKVLFCIRYTGEFQEIK